jgi:hypothetical protein
MPIHLTPLSLRALALAGLLAAGCAHTQDPTARGEAEENAVDAARIEIRSLIPEDELDRRLARFAPTPIRFDPARLDERQRQALKLLVEAARIMDDLFWQQASPEGPALRARLARPRDEQERKLAEALAIHYGAYDRLEEGRAFLEARLDGAPLSAPHKPAGAAYYPPDLTKAEFERQLEARPEDKQAFQSAFTVIRREGDRLVAVPYSRHHRAELERAAGLLRRAAEFVDHPALATYLRSRAEAFLSDDYFQSDVDWVTVRDSELEVTIGPYEVYEDGLFNYKAAFECFLTLRDRAESEKLDRLESHLQDMEQNLPLPAEHLSPARAQESPMLVVDLLFSAGDTRAGVQTMAFNLPNDERVRDEKGSKKVMLKNISHAKFDHILTPIAARALTAEQLPWLDFEAYFTHTLMHEISHGLGPGFIQVNGERTTVNKALKETYSAIEEAKADILGVMNTLYLIERGVLPAALGDACLVTFLAGTFRSVRFGVHEAHGLANLLLFNALLDKGAYRHDPTTGRFSVDLALAPARVRELAGELLMLEALGDHAGAKAMLARYGRMRPEMQAVLDSLTGVPVDIKPVFELETRL